MRIRDMQKQENEFEENEAKQKEIYEHLSDNEKKMVDLLTGTANEIYNLLRKDRSTMNYATVRSLKAVQSDIDAYLKTMGLYLY